MCDKFYSRTRSTEIFTLAEAIKHFRYNIFLSKLCVHVDMAISSLNRYQFLF